MDGIEITTFRGDDGAVVVQVDTTPDIGRVRVNINDAPVWDDYPDGDDRSSDRVGHLPGQDHR